MKNKLTLAIVIIIPVVMLIVAGWIAYTEFMPKTEPPKSWKNGALDPPVVIDLLKDKEGRLDLFWRFDDMADITVVTIQDRAKEFSPIEIYRGKNTAEYIQDIGHVTIYEPDYLNKDIDFTLWSISRDGKESIKSYYKSYLY